MEKTIEETKEELILQAVEDSQGDVDAMTRIIVDIVERVFHYAYDLGYDKGWHDSTSVDIVPSITPSSENIE